MVLILECFGLPRRIIPLCLTLITGEHQNVIITQFPTIYLIESNKVGRWSWNPFHTGALLTLLDCIVLFIMRKSQHGLEGKAQPSSTSSYIHNIQSYSSRAGRAAWSSLPLLPMGDVPAQAPQLPAAGTSRDVALSLG